MPIYSTANIRNIAIVGHTNAGKTTLVEAILHEAKAIKTKGCIDKGDTVCDFTAQEKKRGHSLSTALASCDYLNSHINLVDTPGYPDFLGQAFSILPAVETVAVVINAHAGLQTVTRRMLSRAGERKLCRLIVINKIDSPNIDLPALLEHIQEAFGKSCLPINLPCNGGKGVTNVFTQDHGESDFSSVADAHTAIVEQVVEVDEDLMAKYLEQGEISSQDLHTPFEKALREGHLIPICFTSAQTNAGIPELLDLFVNLMPNPMEGNPRPFIKGKNGDGQEFHATSNPDQHVLAHIFRTTIDPFVGKLSLMRIHQGTITKESQLFIGNAKKTFKVGHLFKIQGEEHPEIDRGIPGDLCAVAKNNEINFDDVLHDSHDEDHIHLKTLNFPKPMYGLAITPKSRGDEQKIAKALHAISAEDPCFRVEHNKTTDQTIIHGLGEFHLRIILEKMNEQFHAEVTTEPPKIAYRETISNKAKGHCRHKKQTGGAGQFGEVYLRIEPLERDAGVEISNDIFGGAIPASFIPAIEKGIHTAIESGCIAGYPMQDLKVSIYDGKHHPVDSKEIAFIAAGKHAFLQAVADAKPTILEPIVDVEITIPEAYIGDINGDLSGKRGHVTGTDTLPGNMVLIQALVPLAELGHYQSQLKSVTAGQGSFVMELSHYASVPPNIQQQLVTQYRQSHNENE